MSKVLIENNFLGKSLKLKDISACKKLSPLFLEVTTNFLFSSQRLSLNLKPTKIKKVYLDLFLCDGRVMRPLNLKYRKKNYATDVLSFPLVKTLRNNHLKNKELTISLQTGELYLGDIFICLPVAKNQAKTFDISFEAELLHLFIHGLLHLTGFDHEISHKEEEIMQKYEDFWTHEILMKLKKI
jgi:probable rRNA maturation factor